MISEGSCDSEVMVGENTALPSQELCLKIYLNGKRLLEILLLHNIISLIA